MNGMPYRNPHEETMLRGGVRVWGDVSPKGSETKETWGDKGREGTPKNGNLGRRLLWMVPCLFVCLCRPWILHPVWIIQPFGIYWI